ncbi:MAG: hypothetical protein IMF12_09675 [Proteobacteria bacterium]|nr:hypothetical protein [Pseudomonadota bacterium]
MIDKKDVLQLIDISANMAASIAQIRAANGDILKDDELKKLFSNCVDMVQEKFEEFPISERETDEKFASIGEMHRIFSEKLASLEKKSSSFDEEKFASISEMHRVITDKIHSIESRLAKIPVPRTSRRPV